MSRDLTLENLIAVIRDSQGIPEEEIIEEHTFLEDDLGITGDDGEELLSEIERVFSVDFSDKDGSIREILDLEEDQYIFHGEGWNPFSWFLSLFGKHIENV